MLQWCLMLCCMKPARTSSQPVTVPCKCRQPGAPAKHDPYLLFKNKYNPTPGVERCHLPNLSCTHACRRYIRTTDSEGRLSDNIDAANNFAACIELCTQFDPRLQLVCMWATVSDRLCDTRLAGCTLRWPAVPAHRHYESVSCHAHAYALTHGRWHHTYGT